ncbi:MAG TPA: trypsin-like peptidase domain-containing protein [bacterium]|nr:trypsin-like peptidase domain-containing protein [bacterium]
MFHSRSGRSLCLGALLFILVGPLAASPDPLRRSVVKIFTTAQRVLPQEPWRRGPEENVSGSGCILPGHLILTNAHVVSNQIFLQVLKDGDTQKYTSHVVAVSHDRDLAVIRVDDPKFFTGTQPVTFGEIPEMRDKISVYGYPVGGDDLSITEGVVSRIEVVTYSHSLRSLLGVQTDAAINPGNSGGPVFRHKRMVGVAFQGYNAAVAQNTGYIIPISIVKRFLDDTKKGADQRVPMLGLYCQTLENGTLRSYLGLKKGQSGMLVTATVYGSSVWGALRKGDVLTAIDGYTVGNDGTIRLHKGERLNFQYPMGFHRIGDRIKLKFLRGGKAHSATVKLKPDARLVPFPSYDDQQDYFIFDGLVFTELDSETLAANKNADNQWMALYLSGLPSPDRRRVVILDHIIPHASNKGYGTEYSNLMITRVNGRPVRDLKSLIEDFEHPVDGRHVLEFDEPRDLGTRIVLKAEGAEEATKEILAVNHIPSDRSDDLKGAK